MVGTNSTNFEGSNYIKQLYEHLVTSNNVYNKSIQLLDRSKHNDIDKNVAINMLNEVDEMLTTAMLRKKNDQ
jgi:two-component sensor histidine kinase